MVKSKHSEKRALSRLVILATLGSIMIVVFYSAYYYSQVNHRLRSKTLIAPSLNTIGLVHSLDSGTAQNSLYSPLLNCLEQHVKSGTCSSSAINWDFAFTVSGKNYQEAQKALTTEMQKRFSTLPPIEIPKVSGKAGLGFMIQQFRLPETFSLIKLPKVGSETRQQAIYTEIEKSDSLQSGFFKMANKGWALNLTSFDEQRLLMGSWVPGESMKECIDRAEVLLSADSHKTHGALVIPLVDFDLSYNLLPMEDLDYANLRIKQLISPNIKGHITRPENLNNSIILDSPMFISLWLKGADKPYLCLVTTNQMFFAD